MQYVALGEEVNKVPEIKILGGLLPGRYLLIFPEREHREEAPEEARAEVRREEEDIAGAFSSAETGP